jgi:hypothetical protein
VAGPDLVEHYKLEYNTELYSWQRALEDKKSGKMAVELLRLATLSIPFRLSEVLEPHWASAISAQLPAGTELTVSGCIPILLCTAFPLYLCRVQLDHLVGEELWRFVVPPVCLQVLRTFSARLPVAQVLEAMEIGELLEVVSRNSMRLRVSETFLSTAGQKFRVLFPFFAGTLVGDEPVLAKPVGSFPKLVSDSKTNTEQEDNAIATIMLSAAADDLCGATVHRAQLGLVLKHMASDVFSKPLGKSKSGDLLYKSANSKLLEMQMKAGKQQLTPAMAVDELSKSCFKQIGGSIVSLTFVFVVVNGVSTKFLEAVKPGPGDSDTPHAFVFRTGATFCCSCICTTKPVCKNRSCASCREKPSDFQVPESMDVVVLKEEGLKFLLTDINLAALKNFEPTLKAARAAISPDDRRRPASGNEGRSAHALALDFGNLGFTDTDTGAYT